MKEKIKLFLDSDLLESYLLGATTTEETLQVERYLSMYPEVRKAYEELQDNLETYAKMYAVNAPEALKERILTSINKESNFKRNFYRMAVAASFAVLISAGSSYFFWDKNQSLQEENSIVNNKIDDLEETMRAQLEDVRNQFIVLQNPETKKFSVKGNKKAQELKAVAYINPVKRLSYINVSKLPHLPKDQCYQMWAEVNGEMVNLGIIKEANSQEKLLALPYAEDAVSYITIEPQGGNQSPTVENIVANIAF